MMNQKFVLILLIITPFFSCFSQSIDIYISPDGGSEKFANSNSPLVSFKTAWEKVKEIRSKDENTPIHLHLSKGEYRLNSPLVITSEMNHLKITGPGSDKVTIKGSRKLNLKWKKYNKTLWVTNIEGSFLFDQLFINHQQQILARYPNYNEHGGHWQGHASDAISPKRVRSWNNPVGAIVHAMHMGEWGDFHYVITGVNKDGDVELSGGQQNNRPSKMHKTYRMVENVFEELDSQGEWFFDKKDRKLYYWPPEDIDINKAFVEVVTLKQLVRITGTEKDPVKDILISGIRFEQTQRTFMEKYEPLLRSDWTIYRGAALFLEGTEKIKINDCEFNNLGGNVLFVSKYNRDVQVSGNHIHDCGASGVCFVGDPKAVRSPSFQYNEFVKLSEMDTVAGPKTNNYPSNCTVEDNLIYRTGRIEKQTAGVQISMSMDITVAHNSIYEVPRAGINISEGTWGGHIIKYNDVFKTVLESSDHGAFNSWGRDRFWHPNRSVLDSITSNNPDMPRWDAIHTTEIYNNRFKCDHGWDIDLDDGSSNYHIYNNLCLKGGIKLREGFYRIVENNIMVNNSFHPHVWFKNSGDIFRNNIVLTNYKDIRLQAWGKEVDYNLFPDKQALLKAQKNGTDQHSIYGNPEFINPKKRNFTVANNSPALKIGFKNFSMNQFGVTKPSLKKIAEIPTFPELTTVNSNSEKNQTVKWLGAKIKNVETMEERSALGLRKTSGVLILELNSNSVLHKSGFQIDDVIIFGEGLEIKDISDLMHIYTANIRKGKLKFKIIRNQKEREITVKTK